MHKVFEILDVNIGTMLIVRLDVFWDKQRVDNCTKSRTEGEVRVKNNSFNALNYIYILYTYYTYIYIACIVNCC